MFMHSVKIQELFRESLILEFLTRCRPEHKADGITAPMSPWRDLEEIASEMGVSDVRRAPMPLLGAARYCHTCPMLDPMRSAKHGHMHRTK